MSGDIIGYISAHALEFQILGILLLTGCLGGFLSGLLGIGGGLVYTPTIYYVVGMSGYDGPHTMHMAVGTSMAAITVNSATSALHHYWRGNVDLDLVKIWFWPLIAGVVTAGLVAHLLAEQHLVIFFTLVTSIFAVYMFFEKPAAERKYIIHVKPRYHRLVALVIGGISTLIGVGGSLMTVPFLNLAGAVMKRAVGTSAMVGVVVAIPATLTYIIQGVMSKDKLPDYTIGYVNYVAALAIIATATLLVPLGVAVASKMKAKILRRIFALFLLMVAIKMAYSLW